MAINPNTVNILNIEELNQASSIENDDLIVIGQGIYARKSTVYQLYQKFGLEGIEDAIFELQQQQGDVDLTTVLRFVEQPLQESEKQTARNNISALDVKMSELSNDLTASEKGIIQDKLGIEDTDLTGLLTNPTYDSDTHIFTMDVIGGSQFQIDFPIEALITNVDLDDDNNLVITFEDGSEVLVPLNTLLVGVVKTVNGKNPNSQGVVTINIADIPNLQDELDNKADISDIPNPANDGLLTISTSSDLTGGGTFSANQATASNVEIGLSAGTLSNIQLGVTANSLVINGGISRTSESLNNTNDLDLVITPGYYHHTAGSQPLNTPVSDAGYLEVVDNGSNAFIRQAWRGRNNGLEYQRTRRSNGNWSDWVVYYNSYNFNPSDYALASQLPTVNDGNITYSGIGDITGGGTSTANQSENTDYTFDLTAQTKSNIALGVTAYGWGDFRDYRLGVPIGGYLNSLDTPPEYTTFLNITGSFFGITNTDRPSGIFVRGGASSRWSWTGVTDKGDIRIYATNSSNSDTFVEVIHTDNLNSFATSLGFIKSADLPTNYVTTNGVQTITATKTFTVAPIVPNGTLNGHTVNLGQLNDALDSYTPEIPLMSNTVIGGAKLYSNTIQTYPVQTGTYSSNRTYAIQLNANGELVVNVPWINTVYPAGTIESLEQGTSTADRVWSASTLHDYINNNSVTAEEDILFSTDFNADDIVTLNNPTVFYFTSFVDLLDFQVGNLKRGSELVIHNTSGSAVKIKINTIRQDGNNTGTEWTIASGTTISFVLAYISGNPYFAVKHITDFNV